MMLVLTTIHPSRATYTSPKTHARASSSCTWALSPQKTYPCITLQETQQCEVRVSLERNLPTENWRSVLREEIRSHSVLDLSPEAGPSENGQDHSL
jgi:hypothetical protein